MLRDMRLWPGYNIELADYEDFELRRKVPYLELTSQCWEHRSKINLAKPGLPNLVLPNIVVESISSVWVLENGPHNVINTIDFPVKVLLRLILRFRATCPVLCSDTITPITS